MQADRLALLKMKKENMSDENLWWNKISKMSEDEMDLLPYSFIKKYGSFI